MAAVAVALMVELQVLAEAVAVGQEIMLEVLVHLVKAMQAAVQLAGLRASTAVAAAQVALGLETIALLVVLAARV